MAVDMLRSCYTTDCNFWTDVDLTAKIVWSFCEENAPDLPFPTIFSSRNWDEDHAGWDGLGEVYNADRPWRDGSLVFPTAGGPPCGNADNFVNGEPAPTDPPPQLNIYGGPSCCPLPPQPFVGACAGCFPGGVWNPYTLIVRGATGFWINSNGNWQLDFIGKDRFDLPCNWRSPVIFDQNPPVPAHRFQWMIQQFGDNPCNFHVTWDQPGAGFGNDYPLVNWNPYEMAVVPVALIVPDPELASQVILLPGIADLTGRFCPAFGAAVADSLLVRIRAAGISVADRVLDQDCPFQRTGPNIWRGTILWLFRTPLLPVIRFNVGTPATLTATADGRMTLNFLSPHGFPNAYLADIAPWDQSPVMLMWQPGGSVAAGLPNFVTLFVFSDLPP